MTKDEAKQKVLALLADAKRTEEWGGDEDHEGTLHPGSVDWETLAKEVSAVMDQITS